MKNFGFASISLLFAFFLFVELPTGSLTTIEAPGEDYNIANGSNLQNNIAPLRITQTGNFPSSGGRSILIDANQIEQSKEDAGLYINGVSQSPLILNSGGGNVSIGSNPVPRSKLHITGGDVYIDDLTSGVIMKSSDGQCWRFTPDNTGNLVSTPIICPY